MQAHPRTFGRLWEAPGAGPAGLAALVRAAFDRHLAGYRPQAGRGWGWKLCETLYAMPLFDFLFPRARIIHLLRDGRDVAWCNHVAPEQAFWRKVYFNTDRIRSWQGRSLSNAAYERRPHLYNALHWRNSVETGRAFGAMLRERYCEIRYEDLCAGFAAAMDGAAAPPGPRARCGGHRRHGAGGAAGFDRQASRPALAGPARRAAADRADAALLRLWREAAARAGGPGSAAQGLAAGKDEGVILG